MRLSDIDTIPCPVARALSVIGDAWTILILRDCFKGATRFEELAASTHAPRAVLSTRLSKLVDAGVLERSPYSDHPARHDYELTDRGRALQPVLMMMAHWSESWMPDPALQSPGRRHTTCGKRFTAVVTCSECGEPVRPGEVTYDSSRAQNAKTASTAGPVGLVR